MDIETTTHDDWQVLVLDGEFDTYASGEVRDRLTELIGAGDPPRVVVDLSTVTFMDSSALGVLVGALRTARTLDGEIRLAAASDKLQPLFRITGLNKTFAMFDTVAQATAAAVEPTAPR